MIGYRYLVSEIWAYRRLLRISWTERKTNQYLIDQMGLAYTQLLSHTTQIHLQYFGHIARHDSLQRQLLFGSIYGKKDDARDRGQ